MDVVNGKIVSARTERSRSEIWSALKPSRGSVMQLDHSGGLMAPPTWGGARHHHGASNNSTLQQSSAMAMEPGAARWHRWSRDNSILGQPHKLVQNSTNSFLPSAGSSSNSVAAIDHSGFGPFQVVQVGWKRSSTAVTGRDYYNNCPGTINSDISSSVALFDEMEMAMLQIPRATCSHFHSSVGQAVSVTPEVRPKMCPEMCPEMRREMWPEMCPGTNASKSQRVERDDVQDGVPWIAPLRSLLRKELTASDVGDLGRIVLPKKDAEGHLPQIETKGWQLEMGEYSFSKRWLFQFKCWVNNKSRMYVLENTGEFIKYHGLKAHDSFIVYEDGCRNLVVRGQKKSDSAGQKESDLAVDHWKSKPLAAPSWMEVK